jgi:hypothetical protein
MKHLNWPREVLQCPAIETVHIRVKTGEDGALCKVLGRMVGSVKARIDRIYQRSYSIFSALKVGWKRNVGLLICMLALAHL